METKNYLFKMRICMHSLILTICLSPSVGKAEDLTAGKLYQFCEHDKTVCNSIFIGLAQGLIVGSAVGAIGTAKQIVGKQHKIINDLLNVKEKNTGIFLGFCQETSMKILGM